MISEDKEFPKDFIRSVNEVEPGTFDDDEYEKQDEKNKRSMEQLAVSMRQKGWVKNK